MSSSTEPLDDRLTDMGRALASSLLGDVTVARPVRAPKEPEAPLSRRARREQREQQERLAAARGERHDFPPPAAPAAVAPTPTAQAPAPSAAPTAPAPQASSNGSAALVRQGDAPALRDGPSTPVAPDGSQFQIARPRRRPAPESDPGTGPATPSPSAALTARGPQTPPRAPQARRAAPQPRPAAPQARPAAPQSRPTAPHGRPEAPQARQPARPQAPTESRPAARSDEPPLRPRIRNLAPDPFAALPWPDDETVSYHDDPRRAPEARPGSRIRDLDLKVARAEPSDEPEAPPEESSQKRLVRTVVEWAMVLGTAAIVALLLQHFVVQLYEIPSESMYPTLQDGDQVMVNKLAYAVGGGVERGDVIVFKRPASERTDDPDQPPQLIKRVIGLPGDVVEARGGVVYIDGKPLEETGDDHYLDPSVVTNNLPQPVTVARGHVFVMGDNRERSHDSRYFGAIPESDIIGRAVVRAWPFSRWGFL